MESQIFVVGRPYQDIFVTCPELVADDQTDTVRLPLGGKLGCQMTITVGGSAANVAATLGRAGLNPKFISRAGNDQAGQNIRQSLKALAVDVDELHLVDGQKTKLSIVLLPPGGERTTLGQHGVGLDFREWQPLLKGLESGDWVFLSSVGDSQTLVTAISQIAARGGRVALNPATRVLHQPQPLIEVLDKLELLIANREETACLFAGQTPAELAIAAHQKIPLVVVTDGPRGSATAAGGQLYEAGLYQSQSPVVDRTGAGDAFSGGFLAGLLLGRPIPETLTWAAANSTSVVGQIGAQAGILDLGQKELEPLAVKQTSIN